MEAAPASTTNLWRGRHCTTARCGTLWMALRLQSVLIVECPIGKATPSAIASTEAACFRKHGRRPITASKRFGPKWLRSGRGSLTRGRGARANTRTFDAMRWTLATRALPAILRPAAPAYRRGWSGASCAKTHMSLRSGFGRNVISARSFFSLIAAPAGVGASLIRAARIPCRRKRPYHESGTGR